MSSGRHNKNCKTKNIRKAVKTCKLNISDLKYLWSDLNWNNFEDIKYHIIKCSLNKMCHEPITKLAFNQINDMQYGELC